MGRGEAATIDAFVSRLQPNIVGHALLRRRVADEMRNHLEESTQRYRARGLSLTDAQRKAIEDFGPPEVVLRTWAESKGVGVPTTFTRYAGLAGVIGAAGLGATFILEQVSLSFSQGLFAEASLSFGALLAVSLVALYMRIRGKLVAFGRMGSRLTIIGFVMATVSSWLWFAPGALVGAFAMLVGLVLYFVGALKTGVVPRGPIAIWIAGVLGSIGLGAVGLLTGIDAGPMIPVVFTSAFTVGWIWLGAHLWSEKPSTEEQAEGSLGTAV